MNIGISVQIYLARQQKEIGELNAFLKVSAPTGRSIRLTPTGGSRYLPGLIEFFGVKASEFIAAGEDHVE